MKRILVPTDFSDNALKAAMYAAELATKNGAGIFFLHASGMAHETYATPHNIFEKYNNLVIDEEREQLEQLVALMKKEYPGLDYDYHVTTNTPVAEAIATCAKEKGADIVIMGTHGAGGLKASLVGSNTTSVLENAHVPLLAIPDAYVPEQPDGILLAVEKFEKDPALLRPVMELARAYDLLLHVVVFIDKDAADAADYVSNLGKMEEYIKFLKNNFQQVRVQHQLLEGESLEDAIELYCLQHDIDLISVISYPKTFFQKLFRKSLTRNLAFHSKIPVLALPAQGL